MDPRAANLRAGSAVMIAMIASMPALALPLPLPTAPPLSPWGRGGFLRGTHLLTMDGPVPVEEIEPGEAVMDPQGRPHFVLWQGGCAWQPPGGGFDDPGRPIRIFANAFGPGIPRRDLRLSAAHRVVVERAGVSSTLRADGLGPHRARLEGGDEPVFYHAIVTREPCIVMAENLACASAFPGEGAMSDPAGRLQRSGQDGRGMAEADGAIVTTLR